MLLNKFGIPSSAILNNILQQEMRLKVRKTMERLDSKERARLTDHGETRDNVEHFAKKHPSRFTSDAFEEESARSFVDEGAHGNDEQPGAASSGTTKKPPSERKSNGSDSEETSGGRPGGQEEEPLTKGSEAEEEKKGERIRIFEEDEIALLHSQLQDEELKADFWREPRHGSVVPPIRRGA